MLTRARRALTTTPAWLIPIWLLAACSGASVQPGQPSGQAAQDTVNKGADQVTNFATQPGNGKLIAAAILVIIGVAVARAIWRSVPAKILIFVVVAVAITVAVMRGGA